MSHKTGPNVWSEIVSGSGMPAGWLGPLWFRETRWTVILHRALLRSRRSHHGRLYFIQSATLVIMQHAAGKATRAGEMHQHVVKYSTHRCTCLLWPPCMADADIIFSFCSLFMAALWNRAGHYIFALWFLLSFIFLSFFFFPRLISAVAEWMSTILPHMVWP